MNNIGGEKRLMQIERALGRMQTRSAAPGYWGACVGAFLALPELRAFWPLSSVNEAGAVMDLSGQGRSLTNTSVSRSMTETGVPFGLFNGTSSYLARADEAGLDITGGLTFGGWFYTSAVDANNRGLIVKWLSTGDQRSYQLYYNNTAVTVAVSSTGAAGGIVTVNGPVLAADTWHFIAGRFSPSTQLAIYADGAWAGNTTSIPASIYSGTAPLEIGRQAAYLSGAAAMCFLCAAVVPATAIENLHAQTRALFGV